MRVFCSLCLTRFLPLLYIKTCGYDKINRWKQQSFFLGYSMNFLASKEHRIGFVLVVMVLCFGIALNYWASASSGYIKIVDGDSLEIGKRRIRLQGIDAPEYIQYCFKPNKKRYSCGLRSKDYLEKMVKQSHYQINCKVVGYDRYRRELSECFSQNKNLNLEMIKNGWAVAYRTDNTDYLQAEKQAKSEKKGIWKGKFMRPEYFRRLQREENQEKWHKS